MSRGVVDGTMAIRKDIPEVDPWNVASFDGVVPTLDDEDAS